MKKRLLIPATIALALLPVNSLLSQTTLTLQPNGTDGKDAVLSSMANTTNYGSHPDFLSIAWTNGGDPTTGRSLVQFDFSAIPSGATIVSAELSLYAYNSASNGSHSTMNGPNTSYLQRITESWDEATVTWNNQPATTTVNQVTLPSSGTMTNVIDMNVTDLVTDMIANGNNGFMIRLATESYYRRMVFASSDNVSPALRPKLVITYTSDCVVLRPGSEGKDAVLNDFDPTLNYGDHPDFLSVAWTNGGTPVTGRSLIQFDYSAIPAGAVLQSAALSLYAYDSPSNGSHSTMDGPNTSYIRRVTQSWDESTVTWDTQPTTTTTGQVTIPSSATMSNATDLDVTSLVSEMLQSGNYGFELLLENESYYRRMIFASGDNANADLHPKLLVCFTDPAASVALNEAPIGFELFPNPSENGTIYLRQTTAAKGQEHTFAVFSASGECVYRLVSAEPLVEMQLAACSPGVYFVHIANADGEEVKKLVLR